MPLHIDSEQIVHFALLPPITELHKFGSGVRTGQVMTAQCWLKIVLVQVEVSVAPECRKGVCNKVDKGNFNFFDQACVIVTLLVTFN